jgi:hypothetical protein
MKIVGGYFKFYYEFQFQNALRPLASDHSGKPVKVLRKIEKVKRPVGVWEWLYEVECLTDKWRGFVYRRELCNNIC